jgi:hypothetical protein
MKPYANGKDLTYLELNRKQKKKARYCIKAKSHREKTINITMKKHSRSIANILIRSEDI